MDSEETLCNCDYKYFPLRNVLVLPVIKVRRQCAIVLIGMFNEPIKAYDDDVYFAFNRLFMLEVRKN